MLAYVYACAGKLEHHDQRQGGHVSRKQVAKAVASEARLLTVLDIFLTLSRLRRAEPPAFTVASIFEGHTGEVMETSTSTAS
jgi:hypothetical protein